MCTYIRVKLSVRGLIARRQSTLPALWSNSTSRTSPKKARLTDEVSKAMSISQSDDDRDSVEDSSYADSSSYDGHTAGGESETSVINSQNESLPGPSHCTALCCSTDDKAFQPTDKKTLAGLTKKWRNF